MPNSDIVDRTEGWGHESGSQTATKDDGVRTGSVPTLAAGSEATTNRLGRSVATPNAESRQYEKGDGTVVGTNAALTTASTEAASTNRTADVMNATERAATGFRDRTSGWGHSGTAAPADLEDV